MMSMDTILVARTWAVYQRSRTVLVLLILGALVCYVPVLVIFDIKVDRMLGVDYSTKLAALMQVKAAFVGPSATIAVTTSQKSLWILDACFIAETPKLLGMIFLASLIYEGKLQVLLSYDGVKPGYLLKTAHCLDRSSC